MPILRVFVRDYHAPEPNQYFEVPVEFLTQMAIDEKVFGVSNMIRRLQHGNKTIFRNMQITEYYKWHIEY